MLKLPGTLERRSVTTTHLDGYSSADTLGEGRIGLGCVVLEQGLVEQVERGR
jgi:hypothetical protein